MKKLFKNIANTAKTTAANCTSSIAAFHSRALLNNAGEGYFDTDAKVLIAVVLCALGPAAADSVLNDSVIHTATHPLPANDFPNRLLWNAMLQRSHYALFP